MSCAIFIVFLYWPSKKARKRASLIWESSLCGVTSILISTLLERKGKLVVWSVGCLGSNNVLADQNFLFNSMNSSWSLECGLETIKTWAWLMPTVLYSSLKNWYLAFHFGYVVRLLLSDFYVIGTSTKLDETIRSRFHMK